MPDRKIAYAASSALTITLASLATSSTLVAGRESGEVDNTTNKYLDYMLGGFITTGTSPTAGKIQVWVVGLIADAPVWPDVFDGTDSAETWTSVDIRNAGGVLAAEMVTDTTSDRQYSFGPLSVAKLFGDVLPKKFVAFVTHNTEVNLNSTGSNHAIHVTGAYETVA